MDKHVRVCERVCVREGMCTEGHVCGRHACSSVAETQGPEFDPNTEKQSNGKLCSLREVFFFGKNL